MSTYIKLEDVQKILSKTSDKYQSEYTGGWIVSKIQEDINSLPSISFEEMINGYLQDIKDNLKKGTNTNLEFTDLIAQKYILEELLNKLP